MIPARKTLKIHCKRPEFTLPSPIRALNDCIYFAGSGFFIVSPEIALIVISGKNRAMARRNNAHKNLLCCNEEKIKARG